MDNKIEEAKNLIERLRVEFLQSKNYKNLNFYPIFYLKLINIYLDHELSENSLKEIKDLNEKYEKENLKLYEIFVPFYIEILNSEPQF